MSLLRRSQTTTKTSQSQLLPHITDERTESVAVVTVAAGAISTYTPVKRVLEQTQPRRHSHRRLPRRRQPRPLPHLHTAFWVRHHGQVPTVGRTQAGNASRTSVGIKRIFSSRRSAIVHVLHSHQLPVLQRLQYRSTFENHSTCDKSSNDICKINSSHGF